MNEDHKWDRNGREGRTPDHYIILYAINTVSIIAFIKVTGSTNGEKHGAGLVNSLGIHLLHPKL